MNTTASSVAVGVSCTGAAAQTCGVTLTLSVAEKTKRGKKLVTKAVVVGREDVSISAGSKLVVKIGLNSAGKKLVKKATIRAKLTVTLSGKTISTRGVVLKRAAKEAGKR